MTIREAVQQAKKRLAEHQVPDYETDALLLLQSVCGIDRAGYYARGGEELKDADLYLEKIRMRSERIPLQQITGESWFCGLCFRVNEDVLCPRPETEILVEEALKRLRPYDRFLDLCTGSGCIAVSLLCLAAQMPGSSGLPSGAVREGTISRDALTGCGCDLSEKALKIAANNAALHGVSDRLELVQGDLFTPVHGTFDMIVSNPPYIASDQIASLMEEVRDHEPAMALDGGGDGLAFYRRILAKAGGYLKENGWLLVEIGFDQADAVRSMFIDNGYGAVQVVRDLAGLDRVVLGQRCV